MGCDLFRRTTTSPVTCSETPAPYFFSHSANPTTITEMNVGVIHEIRTNTPLTLNNSTPYCSKCMESATSAVIVLVGSLQEMYSPIKPFIQQGTHIQSYNRGEKVGVYIDYCHIKCTFVSIVSSSASHHCHNTCS